MAYEEVLNDMNTNRTSIFSEISQELWANGTIDQHNYNHSFEEFQKDFLELCSKEFDDMILIRGEIIK